MIKQIPHKIKIGIKKYSIEIVETMLDKGGWV